MLTEANRICFEPKMSINDAATFLSISRQALNKKLKSQGIICPKINNKQYINFTIARNLFAVPFTKMKIAVELVKGGTGKTTTVDHISACLNTYGARVLMIDADPQGNLTDTKGVDADELPVLIDVLNNDVNLEDVIVKIAPGLDLIPSRIENVILDNKITFNKLPLDRLFKNLLASVIDNYDFIIIDLPPNLGCTVTAATLFADVVVAPISPDKFSVKGLKILQDEIVTLERHYQKKIDYKCFLNKYNGNTILSKKIYDALINDSLQNKILKTVVRQAQEVTNLTDANHNLFTTLKSSPTKNDFDYITRELFGIILSNDSKCVTI
jgi:chromosome partitioning protein